MKIAPVTTVVQRPFLLPTAVFVMLVLLTILLEIRHSSLFSYQLRSGSNSTFFFSEGMVFGKIAVRAAVSRNSDTD